MAEITLNSFHPQAYLMYLNFSSAKSLKLSTLTPASKTTGVHQLRGLYQPEAVMSKVYNAKDSTGKKLIKAHFFNLETHKISALVPELRFYKAQNGTLEPFFFPVSTIADEAATTLGHSRTKGSGIKSFNVKTEGSNPFEAPKFLSADLVLYVDNLANLFDTQPGYAPLADLFTISIARSAQKSSVGGATLTSGDFVRPIEVAATLGYSIPDTSLFTQEEIREIQDSNLDIRMNVFHHSIDINQDGSANISIKYTARINNTGRDRIFSATDHPVDLLKRANIKQLFAPQKKKINKLLKKKKISAAESSRRSQVEKMAEIRKILEILESEKKIFSLYTVDTKLAHFAQLGIPDNVKGFSNTARGAVAASAGILSGFVPPPSTPEEKLLEKDAETFEKGLANLDNSKRRVYYVAFGDLIQAFFEKTRIALDDAKKILSNASSYLNQNRPSLDESEINEITEIAKKSADERTKIRKVLEDAIGKLKTFRVYLPDIEYKYYKIDSSGVSEDIKRVNLSDIPISLETYQAFMFDKVMNSHRNTYTIPQFLNDCVTDLLPSAFGQKWSKVGIAPRVISTAPKFTTATFSGPQLRGSLSRSPVIDAEKTPSPQKNFRSSNMDDACDYFIIYQEVDREMSSDRSGAEDQDSRDGIYHFEIGKNRGLTKKISFKRFEVEGAQEQLMTNQVGLYDELKLPYSADISMVGNNLFIPGSQIYINPSNIGFGSPTDHESPAFKIGLGGYYTVLKIATSFNDGILSTDLECTFGSHASYTVNLSGEKIKEKRIDSLDSSEASNDATPQEIPDLDINNVLVAQSHYLQQLQLLKNPTTGEQVLDAHTAKQISNDYILHQDSNLVAIPGVLGKSINSQSGAVRYNLSTGQSVEIDDGAHADEAVKLVKSSVTTLSSANPTSANTGS